MHATLWVDFVFSRILISVFRISTMHATKFGRGSDLGNHDQGRATAFVRRCQSRHSRSHSSTPRRRGKRRAGDKATNIFCGASSLRSREKIIVTIATIILVMLAADLVVAGIVYAELKQH